MKSNADNLNIMKQKIFDINKKTIAPSIKRIKYMFEKKTNCLHF